MYNYSSFCTHFWHTSNRQHIDVVIPYPPISICVYISVTSNKKIKNYFASSLDFLDDDALLIRICFVIMHGVGMCWAHPSTSQSVGLSVSQSASQAITQRESIKSS